MRVHFLDRMMLFYSVQRIPTVIRVYCEAMMLPQYCGSKGPIGYFHETNQNSGFQTVAVTLKRLFPPNQSA